VRDSTERPLVDALRRGDAGAFDTVYARYRGRIHGFLLRLSGRKDDDALPAARAPDADARADAARDVERLERAMASLPASSREVLLLVGVEGFDQEQAAAMLGIKYDALRQRLARARAQLAEKLAMVETKEALA
jgi:RNA polymerase sigma factor (sigma-70 family)